MTVDEVRAGARYPLIGDRRARFNERGYRWQGTLMSQGGFLGAGVATIVLLIVVAVTAAPVADLRACTRASVAADACPDGLSGAMTGVALVGVALACLSLLAVLLQLAARNSVAGDGEEDPGLWFLTRPGAAVSTGTVWGLLVAYGAVVTWFWLPSLHGDGAAGAAWLGWITTLAMTGMVATMLLVPVVMWLTQARTTPAYVRGREAFLRRRLAELLPVTERLDLRDPARTGYPPRLVLRAVALVAVAGALAFAVRSDPFGPRLVLAVGSLGLWSWACLMLVGEPRTSTRVLAAVAFLVMAVGALLPVFWPVVWPLLRDRSPRSTPQAGSAFSALATAVCSYVLFEWGRAGDPSTGLWMLAHPLRVARARGAAAFSDELAWWARQPEPRPVGERRRTSRLSHRARCTRPARRGLRIRGDRRR